MSNPQQNQNGQQQKAPAPQPTAQPTPQRIVALYVANEVSFAARTRKRFFLDGTAEAAGSRKSGAEKEQVARTLEWFVRGQSVVVTASIDGAETTEVLILGPGDRVRLEDAAVKA